MAIDPILERLALQDVLEVPGRLLVALAVDGHRPGLRLEAPGVLRRRVFIHAELVVIVVGRNLFPRVGFLRLHVEAQGTRLDVLEFASMRSGLCRLEEGLGANDTRCRGCGRAGRRLDELPAVHVQAAISNLRAWDVSWAFDQHTFIIRACFADGWGRAAVDVMPLRASSYATSGQPQRLQHCATLQFG